jgi:cytoskeletal protein CcmA (bactofilin family)
MADVKFLSNLVVDGNITLTAGGSYQIKNATFESLTADPSSNNFEGRMIYRSDTNQVRFYDGSAWTSIAGDITGVTAGNGLSGGGATGTVTLDLDLSELTAISAVAQGDHIPLVDASDSSATKKVTFSDLEDAVFGNVSGDITIAAGGAATISANSVALGTDTTGNYVATLGTLTGLTTSGNTGEGSTPTLAVTYGTTATTALEGNTTVDDVSVSNLMSRLGQINSNTTIGANSSVEITTSGNLVVNGNLSVDGTTTTVNSTTLTIDDHHIKVATDNAGTNDFGYYGRYNSGSSAVYAGLFFDVSGEAWRFYRNNPTEPGNTTFSEDELADLVAGNITGQLTGNASTATKWQTARTITLDGDLSGSVSIDGSADVELTATIVANAVALGTDTTGNYVATIAATSGTGISVSGSGSETAAVTIAGIDASTTVKGVVELATTAETLDGSSTTLAVTPAGLAARSYRTAIGDGSATSIAVTHSLGTRDVIVQLYDASSYETVYAQVVRTSASVVTLDFNTAPSTGDVVVLVTKID